MRFLQIGDVHLGPNDRNVDRLAALDQIIAEGLELSLDAWLIPGDLNDGRMTIADRNAWKERFKVMAAVAPVVVAYGNHDLAGDLDIFADLGTPWPIYVVAVPQTLYIRTAQNNGKAAIFVLPYPQRAGLVAAGTPSEQVPEMARQALDVIFMSAAAELAQARTQGWTTLMIGHVNVGGSIMSAGQPNIGREIELDPTLLDRLGPIPVLLNHIHKAQSFSHCHAYYAGSVCRLDWGEIETKRYLLLHYDNGVERPDVWRAESMPIDVPPMYHVDGVLTRDGFDWRFAGDSLMLLSPPDSGPAPVIDCAGADVRVRYRFVAAEKAALNFDLVKAPFVGARRLVLDPIAEPTRALRAPEIAAAQTLEQKVTAFVRGAGVTWTPALETKFAALQHPDGAAFLTDLESTIAAMTGAIDAETPQEVCQ